MCGTSNLKAEIIPLWVQKHRSNVQWYINRVFQGEHHSFEEWQLTYHSIFRFLFQIWQCWTKKKSFHGCFLCKNLKGRVYLLKSMFGELTRSMCELSGLNLKYVARYDHHKQQLASSQLALRNRRIPLFERMTYSTVMPLLGNITHILAHPPAMESVLLNLPAHCQLINALATNGNHWHFCSWCCNMSTPITSVSCHITSRMVCRAKYQNDTALWHP